MPDGYTEEDVRLVADALWRAAWGETAMPPTAATRRDAEAALRALASSGRLLPEGAEIRTQFVLRWYFAANAGDWVLSDDPSNYFIDWGSSTLAAVRDLADVPPIGAVRGEIRSREHWDGPWSVVEPVAVKEASDG